MNRSYCIPSEQWKLKSTDAAVAQVLAPGGRQAGRCAVDLKLLRRGASLGHHKDGGDTVGSSLDHLIGTWTSEEAAEMDRALQDLSHVDEAMRK